MDKIDSDEIKDLIQKYNGKLNSEFLEQNINSSEDFKIDSDGIIRSHEFSDFKKEYTTIPSSFYEKMCSFAEKTFNIKPSEVKEKEILESIRMCHLNVTPAGVYSLSILLPLAVGFILAVFSYLFFSDFFLITLSLGIALAMIKPVGNIPKYLAQRWRMKSGNQMIMCVFYTVTYMRHTSNLELALDFAAEHLSPPLSIDIKGILWDVETQKYSNITDSLDAYLSTWKDENPEFVESMHLITSSLYESSEARRIDLLDKSLSAALDGTFERMLHFAQNLQSPLATFNMLGIVMPVLMLVILPLMVSFMEGIMWYHLAALFDVILPISLYFMQYRIMSTRPSGYGDTEIPKDNPMLAKMKNPKISISKEKSINLTPGIFALIIFVFIFSIGLVPVAIHFVAEGWDIGVSNDIQTDLFVIIEDYVGENIDYYFLDYHSSKDGYNIIGPFGLGASLLSVAFPLALGLSLGLYYKLKSDNLVKLRENSKKMEQEFATCLFQLGNRLADGIPVELAFDRVAETMSGTQSGQFFNIVSMNINKMGMSVSEAIFNQQYGALVYYPSKLIESSMKVLVESSKKGPLIASSAVINVSRYIKEMHKVDERLKDLLSEVMSSMNAQVKFLSPVISGVVVGITAMITTILGKLANSSSNLQGVDGAGAGNTLQDMFGDGMPTYYFQAFVGIYIVELIYILSILINGINNGVDKLGEEETLGKNLLRGTLMYCGIAFTVILLFNLITNSILKGIN